MVFGIFRSSTRSTSDKRASRHSSRDTSVTDRRAQRRIESRAAFREKFTKPGETSRVQVRSTATQTRAASIGRIAAFPGIGLFGPLALAAAGRATVVSSSATPTQPTTPQTNVTVVANEVEPIQETAQEVEERAPTRRKRRVIRPPQRTSTLGSSATLGSSGGY